MRLLSIFTLLLFRFSVIIAQVNITGNVMDDEKNPILYGSIALIGAKDSLLIKGALTDDLGNYVIENVGPGEYRILASYVGYDNVYSDVFKITLENKKATVDINFLNKGIALQEAVVIAKKPFLEQKSDRLVVNVSNSAIAAGGTAMEILQKVPGVVVLQDKVTLGGSTSLQVYIDGKPSQYTDMNALLKDMPGDQIEKIEFITQPGAQFDASGGPILNIVLKRNADLGWKTTLGLTVGGFREDQSDVDAGNKTYNRINPFVNFNYRVGKVNLSANTSYNQGNYFTIFIVDRFIEKDLYKNKNFDETNYNFRNARINFDYYLTDKTTLGATFRRWGRNGEGDANSRTNVFIGNNTSEPSYDFLTKNISNSTRSGTYSSVGFKHEFNKKFDRTLSFDLDYNKIESDNVNDLEILNDLQPNLRSRSKQQVIQPVNIYVAKADYRYGIDSTLKFETGVKSSFANVDNDLVFTRNNQISVGESNEFLYKENINAAYVNLNKKISKFEFNVGLRTEQTIVSGITSEVKVLDRNYLQFFPSANMLYRLNGNLAIQTAYSKRVNRPGFNQQNPFSYFIDSLTYTRGNPNLKPEIANNAQVNLTFDGQPFFGVSYSKTNDVIIENAPRLEGTKTFTIAENLANQERLEIQLNFPIKFGKYIDGFGGNQAIRNSYNATYLGTEYKASRWHWLAYWQVNGKLPKNFRLEIGGFYMTKFLEEFLLIDNLAAINFGLSKSFAKEKGRVSLSFNDILYNQKTRATIDFQNVRVNFNQRDYSRNLRLTMSYTFGNTKVKSINKASASESESSRVKID